MPSFEQSNDSSKSNQSSDSEGLDKIISIFNKNSSDDSTHAKSARARVALKHNISYEKALYGLSQDTFKHTAGCDLSAIFFPFQTVTVNSGLPCLSQIFLLLSVGTVAQGSGEVFVNGYNLLPFRWEKARTNQIMDRWASTSGDSLASVISAEAYYHDSDRFRDVSNIRSMGIRLPAMGVGWGYTLGGVPVPSGSSSPNGTKFKGEHSFGWMVDPSDYIAAPIDLRYDERRNVWTTSYVRMLEGKVTDPPQDETEFTDNRYWVKIQINRVIASATAKTKWNPENHPAASYTSPIVVTNLAEQREATHSLPVGQYVELYEVFNLIRDSGASGIIQYIMSEGGGSLGTPQYMFQVYQGVAANTGGWDYVRAHPTV
jgi:hypothetical protein